MSKTQHLRFLGEKIREAKTAIFTDLGDAAYKIKTSVVQVLQVEANGALWIVVPRPAFHSSILDPVFPVQMEFRRKGLGFNIQVIGLGQVMDDANIICDLMAETYTNAALICEEFLAIRVKMQSADYFEAPSKRFKSVWQQLQQSIGALLLPAQNHRVFQF